MQGMTLVFQESPLASLPLSLGATLTPQLHPCYRDEGKEQTWPLLATAPAPRPTSQPTALQRRHTKKTALKLECYHAPGGFCYNTTAFLCAEIPKLINPR